MRRLSQVRGKTSRFNGVVESECARGIELERVASRGKLGGILRDLKRSCWTTFLAQGPGPKVLGKMTLVCATLDLIEQTRFSNAGAKGGRRWKVRSSRIRDDGCVRLGNLESYSGAYDDPGWTPTTTTEDELFAKGLTLAS